MSFGFREIVETLEQIAHPDLVLIGGQALNYWASVLGSRDEGFTSKDLDMLGTMEALEFLATRLDTKPILPRLRMDPVAVGGVKHLLPSGKTLTVEVLHRPFGLDPDEVNALAIAVVLPSGREFRVLHPVLMMESRILQRHRPSARERSRARSGARKHRDRWRVHQGGRGRH